MSWFSTARQLTPARLVASSFAGLILVGALALSLPVMQGPNQVSALDCLFTATSAVCVTGLITVDTATAWSGLGQIVIALLIQLGGLGIMTFSVALLYLSGRKPSPKSHQALRGALGPIPAGELGHMTKNVILYTLALEGVGALVLMGRFAADHPLPQAAALAAFHSVSAFCNAGFSLFGNNLESFPKDPAVNLVVMALVVLGGLGFVVLREARGYLADRLGGRRRRVSLHTRLALWTTACLLMGGALLLWILELPRGGGAWGGDIWPLLFTAVTPRTAGFNTIPLGVLGNASLLLIMILMFVGASPGSTGGGVKTTTLATLAALTVNLLRGRPGATVMKRTIPVQQVGQALTLVLGSILIILTATLVLVSLDTPVPAHDQRGHFLTLLFEAVSAFGTVGLSLGATAWLTPAGKLVIIALMFIGRLGPITMVYTLGQRFRAPGYTPAEERVMLG